MTNALERRERGDAVMIPVILRPCAWHQLRIGKLLAATVEAVSRSWNDSPQNHLQPDKLAAHALLTLCLCRLPARKKGLPVRDPASKPRPGGFGDICYSKSGISEDSYNESMDIADNGQLIGFRPLMGGFGRTALDQELGLGY